MNHGISGYGTKPTGCGWCGFAAWSHIVLSSARAHAAVSFSLTVKYDAAQHSAFSCFPRRRFLVRIRFGFTAPSIARC
jgi:hypothetical protein